MRVESWMVAALVAVGTLLGSGAAAAGPKLPCDGLEDCKRRCSQRDGASCERLAVFEGGPEERLAALDRSCAARHAPGCVALGRLIASGHEADRFARAVPHFEKACKASEQAGCVELGRILKLGADGVAKDQARAAQLFRAGCDAGHGGACVALAWAVAEGAGVPADPADAKQRLERACEAGNGQACGEYGEALRYGRTWGLAKDEARSQTLRERGCTLGFAPACERLAADAAVAKDGPREAKFRGLLCQAALDPRHCLSAGGNTPTSDRDGRLKWYALGCELGGPSSCALAAHLLRREVDDAPVDGGRRAHALVVRACALGSSPDCVDVATDILHGRGVTANPRAALAQLGKLCKANADQGLACEALAGALEAGTGGKPDHRGAAALYARLCQSLEDDGDGYELSPSCEGRTRHEALAAAQVLVPKCAKGDAASCFEVGKLSHRFYDRFPQQIGVTWRDNPLLAFQRSCELGLGEACVWHAERGDAASARETMGRGCELGHFPACTYLAEWLIEGRHGSADVPRGLAMLEKGCEEGRDGDCEAWGRVLIDSKVPALKDVRRGHQVVTAACARMKGPQTCTLAKRSATLTEQLDLEEACAAGKAEACLDRARKVTQANYPEKDRFLTLACDGGSAEGCEVLGAELLKKARHRDVDGPGALRALDRACTAGRGNACANAAALVNGGTLVPRDQASALVYYERACRADSNASCRWGADLALEGAGGSPDQARALALLAIGCERKDQTMCAAAQRLRTPATTGPVGAPKSGTLAAERQAAPKAVSVEQTRAAPAVVRAAPERRFFDGYGWGAFELSTAQATPTLSSAEASWHVRLAFDRLATTLSGDEGIGIGYSWRVAGGVDASTRPILDLQVGANLPFAIGSLTLVPGFLMGFDAIGFDGEEEGAEDGFAMPASVYLGFGGVGRLPLSSSLELVLGVALLERGSGPIYDEQRYEARLDYLAWDDGAMSFGATWTTYGDRAEALGAVFRLDL